MKKIAEALTKAGTGINTVGGRRLDERPPGEHGTVHGVKVNMGRSDEVESQEVGTLSPVIVIPAVAEAGPFGDKWPPENPAIAQSIYDTVMGHLSKDGRGGVVDVLAM